MVPFSLDRVIDVLERTPVILDGMLSGLPEAVIHQNEGAQTWSAFDIMGHLIHGEKTDWIPRTEIILFGAEKAFEPFDRFAQEQESVGKTFDDLMHAFGALRKENLQRLKSFQLSDSDFDKEGIHPALGKVTLRNLLACWAAHDQGHIYQLSRVLAKQFKEDAGPWVEYLRVLRD